MKLIEILLVEDNPGDVELTRRALEDIRLANNLHVEETGEGALAYLKSDAPRPELVLLDLNLPRMRGMDVLRAIRADHELCTLPVVMLTSSEDPSAIEEAYRESVNCFVKKPLGLTEFTEVVRSVGDFWIGIVKRPGG